MKKLTALLLSILLVMTLFAGCTNTGGNDTPSGGDGQTTTPPAGGDQPSGGDSEKLDATVSMWYYPRYEGFEQLINDTLTDAVKEEYGITLKGEMLAWDNGPEKFTVACATGATPDIYLDGWSRCSPAVAADLCIELGDLAADLKSVMKESYLEDGFYNGKQYYIANCDAGGYQMGVNRELVEKLGVADLLPEDHVHWSYADFTNFMQAVYDKSGGSTYGYAPFAGSQSSDAYWYSWILAAGGKILNDDHTKFVGNSEQTIKFFQLWKDLSDKKLIPDGSATIKDEETNTLFYSGLVAAHHDSVGSQTTLNTMVENGEVDGFTIDLYMVPTPDGGEPVNLASWGTDGFIVFKNGGDENVHNAAKKVIQKWLSTPEWGETYAVQTGRASVRLEPATIDYGDDHLNEMGAMQSEWAAKYATADFGILEPWWTEFRASFYPQMQTIFTGDATAEEAAAAWEAAAQPIIDKGNAG